MTNKKVEEQRIIEDIDSVIRNPETLALARLPGGERLILDDIRRKGIELTFDDSAGEVLAYREVEGGIRIAVKIDPVRALMLSLERLQSQKGQGL